MVGETSATTNATTMRTSTILGREYTATTIPKSAQSGIRVPQEKNSPVGVGTGTSKNCACYNNPMMLYRSISQK